MGIFSILNTLKIYVKYCPRPKLEKTKTLIKQNDIGLFICTNDRPAFYLTWIKENILLGLFF